MTADYAGETPAERDARNEAARLEMLAVGTARIIAGDDALATRLVRQSADPATLAWQSISYLKVLVELLAGELGITPAEWWHGFCQRYATHP